MDRFRTFHLTGAGLLLLAATLIAQVQKAPTADEKGEALYLQKTRQLTFAGRRAGEGYFSADGKSLIFQSEREPGNPFFQIYHLDLETGDTRRISPGHGKTTCAWIHPGGKKILYASSHEDAEARDKQKKELEDRLAAKLRRYSWDYDHHYDIFESSLEGTELKNLTKTKGYDAEGSYSPDGNWIAFASNRHAYTEKLSPTDQERFDLKQSYLMDIYLMRSDGTEVKRLTDVKGYDGGPFFSPDGKRICWRRFNEKGDMAEIWTMNVDGTDQKQITRLGAMSWAPFYHPSGQYLIFATNLLGFANFELFVVDAHGQREPVRITHTDGFDGLPAFSPDGKTLSWTSNRTGDEKSQLFLASWNHEAAMKSLALTSTPNSAKPSEQPDPSSFAKAIDAGDLKQHIEYLASEKLEGRMTGTPGEILATDYVAGAFKAYGIEPFLADSYFQTFPFTAGVKLGEDNQFRISTEGNGSDHKVEKDWIPLSFSSTGKQKAAKVVFAGYGMEVPEGEGGDVYSSYAHLDVEGKWVLLFRYMPEQITPERRQELARFSSLRYKALVARQKGALGILVVSGPNAQVKRQLIPLTFDASLAGSGIPALSISDATANTLLKPTGKSLKDLQDKLDTGDLMAGIQIEGIEVEATIAIDHENREGRNVIGRLPATDPPAGEKLSPLLIGAHVDHLGSTAGANSRAVDDEESNIHYGADDNASGVAGMLEIAQYLSAQQASGKLKLKRDVLFAAWSGEELGLLGSAYFARQLAGTKGDENATLTKHLTACLNMDMIGRLSKSLVLQGIGSSDYWKPEIEKRNAPIGLPLTLQTDSYISTDATSFFLKEVPILNAFTGAHEEYHTPRDTPDKINYEGAESIARFMGLVARSLALSETSPSFKAMKPEEDKGNRAQLRVYLGTIPDYAQGDVAGVKLSGVRKGGPAEKGGVQAGDIIVRLAGKELKNIYDYTFVMGAMKIGEEVEMEVLRGKEKVKLMVTPGSRD